MVALVALTSGTFPHSALAQPSGRSEGERADHDRAVVLMKLGSEQFKAGNFTAARAAFQDSYRLRPTFDTACSLGQTEVKLRNYVEAAEHYRACIESYPTSGSPERLEKIKTDRDEVLKEVGRVHVEFPETGVHILVDDEEVGTTPLQAEIYLPPGTNSVTFRSDDGREISRAFSLQRGQKFTLRAEFDRPPASPAPAAQETPQPVPPPPPPTAEETHSAHNWVPAYVLGGVTVATLATSVVFRVAAGKKKDRFESMQDDFEQGDCSALDNLDECSELSTVNSGARTFATASDVTLIVGGVGAAATVGYVIYELVRTRKSQDSGRVAMQPDFGFGRGAGWVTLSGTF